MFEVQIVRRRKASDGLQALRQRFFMVVSDRCLTITVRPPSPSSFAVLSIPHNRIKGVRVRGKLLRAVVVSGEALTVRLQSQEEALRAAETMMEIWGIDPLVESCEAKTDKEVECGLDEIAKSYVNDLKFRQLVHEIHDHLERILAREGWTADG